jgi:drug/metabolite transporter (DMT)-like permease
MNDSNRNSDIHANITRGYTIAIISAVILSTTAIFIRHLTQTYQLPPLILAFWRNSFVVLCLLPFVLRTRRQQMRLASGELGHLCFYGLILAVFNAMWTFSVALNGAAVATVLVYSSAAFTALLARWILAEKLSPCKIAAVVLSLAGCLLVSDALDLQVWRTGQAGIATGLLSGLSYAGYSLCGRSASSRGLDTWVTLLYIFAIAALIHLVINLTAGLLPGGGLPGAAKTPAELFWLGRAWSGWGWLIALAAGPTLLGFGTYNISLSYLPSSVANLVLSSEPISTAIIAYLVFGETLGALQIIGGGIILFGVVLLRIDPVAARPEDAPVTP